MLTTLQFVVILYVSTLVLVIVNGQITDRKSLFDSVCISGSILSREIDGKYNYFDWNSEINATVYYNNETKTYLYPSRNNANSPQFMISDDPNNSNISSVCFMNNVSVEYIFNVDDCFKNWISKVNNTWIIDTNMRLINCNDICIEGNSFFNGLVFDGTYSWSSFNRTRNTSIYHCKDCYFGDGAYLYGWIWSTLRDYYWYISSDSFGVGLTHCFLGNDLGINYIFNLKDCTEWESFDGTSYNKELTMTIEKCQVSGRNPIIPGYDEKLCIIGSIIPSINGEYYHWNDSIYYSMNTGNYLYYLYINSTIGHYKFHIGPLLTDNNTISYCQNDDCFDGWMTKIDDNGTQRNDDKMRMINCNNICISGNDENDKSWLDGMYVWSHFDYTTNSSVYYCSQCNDYYLYGWIYSWGDFYWKLASDHTTSVSNTDCYLGNDLGPNYIFDLENCVYWESWDGSSWVKITGIQANKCDPTPQPTNEPTPPTPSPTLHHLDRICVSGSIMVDINGEYDYLNESTYIHMDRKTLKWI